jgi:hypothetical protein
MDFLPRRRPRPGAARPGGPASPPTQGLRVLFLGSSFTYGNDMPFVVQAFASAVGESLDVAMVARGGASLEDQWNGGEAVRRIKEGGWSHVVLQQGPSSLPESRANMREYALKLAEPIRKVGARPALYMVWPGKSRLAWFDEVRTSYELTAEDVGGMLIPAGEAWRAVWRRDPGFQLYRRDGEHPSPAGSFLVALSIFGMLCGRSPVGLPERVRLRNGSFAQVSPDAAPLLQESAAEANERFGRP